ncbi:unnamed protein product [Rotaria sp. Silwood1]|nr:unnamed protein product [Rotaria sp. Silwood1]CAF1391531.1 unnamed protein product [Rotaria sp. Silwood1]CAF3561290.1 unnamed protein product [Rotaria sp. Silwood1]CAF4858444.1 unnamed protein product [Rotaria sp. Silwood1]
MMIFNTNNLVTAYLHPNNQLNSTQRQQYSIRRSKVLAMKTLNLLYTELNKSPTKNNYQQKIKRDLDRQSPILIRRHCSKLENLSPHQESSDVHNIFGNQLQTTLSSHHSTSQNKSSRRFLLNQKPLNYSKTISAGTIKHNTCNAKVLYPLQMPIWTPILPEKEETRTRILRSKTHSLKHSNNRDHQLKQGKTNLNSKQKFIPKLYITSRLTNNHLEMFTKTNIKDFVDEWEDSESNICTLSDSEESIVTHCNGPLFNQNLQVNNKNSDYFALSTLISNQQSLFSSLSNGNSELKPAKITSLRQHAYSTPLPPVVEHANDEEIYDDIY